MCYQAVLHFYLAVFTVRGLFEWRTMINLSARLLSEHVTWCCPQTAAIELPLRYIFMQIHGNSS